MLPGVSFTKEKVLKALGLTRTSASKDAQLFNSPRLQQFPDIIKWMKEPDGVLSSKFSKMTNAQFDEYQEDELRKMRKQSALKRTVYKKEKHEFVEGSSKSTRKRAATPSESNDSESEEVEYVGRKSKKLRKRALSVSSDNLDG